MATSSIFKITTGLLLFIITVNVYASIEQSLTIPFTLETESNPQMSDLNVQSVNRFSVLPSYSIASLGATNTWFINASLRVERSSDETVSQDRDDPGLNLGWTHQYETGELSVDGLINDQSTRVSEFTESGIVVGDNTRKTRRLSVNWANSLSDRSSIVLNATGTQVSFVGQATAGLIDYRDDLVSSTFNYNSSEKLQTFARISFSFYKPDGVNDGNIETRSMDLGINWEINQQINISASVGPNKEIRESLPPETSWQGNLNIEYATLRARSNLSMSREQAPNSLGNLEESNRYAINWSYDISEQDNINMAASLRENLSSVESETLTFTINYMHVLNQSWNLGLTAEHRAREDSLTNVSSNRIMTSIIYNIQEF